MPEEQKRKFYCNRCRRETNHNLHASYSSFESDDEHGFDEKEQCFFYECAGCEAATLLIQYSNNVEDGTKLRLYPERQYDWRSPKRFVKLPRKLALMYMETVRAYNRGSFLLSTIGLRALIEGVCDDKGAKGKTLEEKIDALGIHFGNQSITSYLHGFRFSGNEAAHQLEPLSKDDCNQAITVMEDLLNYLYDLDYKASQMKHAQRQTTTQPATQQSQQQTAPVIARGTSSGTPQP
jgi:hypothetical protein